jgi:hypothetical protein
MNQVELCNLALSRVGHGASKPLQSLDEGGEAANACKRVFQPAMDALLREYAWPFATRSAALSLSADTVEGWEYVYAYPDNCAYLLAIGDAGMDATRLPAKACRRAFGLIAAAGGESLLVATNTPDARAWYTVKLTNPHFGDALFQDALAWRVAGELGLALKADPAMAQGAGQQYTLALSKALAAVGNEDGSATAEWNREADTITARGYDAAYPWEAR